MLDGLWDDAVARSRLRVAMALDDAGLDGSAHVSAPDGRHTSLRRLLLDLIEGYGRHTSHADLLREGVDPHGHAFHVAVNAWLSAIRACW